MKTINIKKYFLRTVLLGASFCILAGFLIKKDNRVPAEAVSIKVEQQDQNITVSVKAAKKNKTQFYMFNIEGRLIKDLNIYGTKTVSITQVEKGFYTYEFFNEDERIKSGEIELK